MGRGRQHYEVYCKRQHLNPDWERLPQQVKDEWDELDKRAEDRITALENEVLDKLAGKRPERSAADAVGDPPPEVPPIIPT